MVLDNADRVLRDEGGKLVALVSKLEYLLKGHAAWVVVTLRSKLTKSMVVVF